jgi:uncharacterized membrane protein YjjP (DUF1212 family)
MTLEERSNLVLAYARALYVNGQSTDQILAAADHLGDALGLRAKIMPRWGELKLQAEDGDAKLICATAADPTGVDMNRVASATRAIEDLGSGRLASAAAMGAISAISRAPLPPTWLFTLAAAAGAVALAVLFGVQHLPAAALIFVSAAAGAILRRSLAKFSANVFLQPFCAALLAGVIGALAVRYQRLRHPLATPDSIWNRERQVDQRPPVRLLESARMREITSLECLALLIVLSITAGCTDIIGFLGLNGLFTAHITGNLVILAAHIVGGGEAQIAPMQRNQAAHSAGDCRLCCRLRHRRGVRGGIRPVVPGSACRPRPPRVCHGIYGRTR